MSDENNGAGCLSFIKTAAKVILIIFVVGILLLALFEGLFFAIF